jgi:hypothetical protein
MFVQTSAHVNTVHATKQLTAPIGYGLDGQTPSLTANDGSIALNSTGDLYYAGNNIWKPLSGGAPDPGYGFVYNTDGQTIASAGLVTFGFNGPLNGVSFTPGTSNIVFTKAGTYSAIFYIITAFFTDNQFALYLNGSKIYTTFLSINSPNANTGYGIINATNGDVLTLVNRSQNQTDISASQDGFGDPTINASILLTKIS